jgi:hypothetical protein
MAVAERSTTRRVTAVAVVVALGLALAAVVATVGSNSEAQPTQFDSLLDRSAADAARKASYQGNVGTVYDHLQQIIDKILWHKDAWEKSYKGDLTRVANEVAAAVKVERDASKASDEEAGKAAAAAAIAASKKNIWVAKAAAMTAKKADAEEEKKALKALFEKGNAQKGGEIEMIKKIRCMMSAFNKDGKWKCDGSDSAPAPAPVSVSVKKDGGVFGKAPSGDRICILVDPKIVDMKANEEGPNMIADITKEVPGGATRLFKFTDIVATLSSSKCDGATLVLPEFQNRDINTDEGNAIRKFVQAGGSAILADDALNRIMSAIKIVDPSLKWQAGGTATATKKTSSARFDKCPSSLPALNGGNSILESSLGSGAQSLYTASGGKVMVAQVKSGAGQLWFLGFDWYAKSGREGWAKVLAAIIG